MSGGAPELTTTFLDQLRRDFAARDVRVVYHYRRGGLGQRRRVYAILKGPGGWNGARLALTLLSPFCPNALIEKGGVVPSGVFEVLVWLNASEEAIRATSMPEA